MYKKEEVSKKVDEIYDVLVKDLRKIKGNGLLRGMSGILLFIANFQKIKNIELVDIDSKLDSLAEAMSNTKFNCSYDNGISGICWVMNHLANNFNTNSYDLDEVRDLIFQSSIAQLNSNRNDFLHQGLGSVLCFLENEAVNECQQYVESLYENAIKLNDDSMTWVEGLEMNHLDEVQYNLGIAHGVPGILLILTLLEKEELSSKHHIILQEMLENGSSWLLKQKNMKLDTFPYALGHRFEDLDNISQKSRLAWCYGDLGIGYSLLKAGISLNNDKIKNEGLRQSIETCARLDKKEAGIHDAGLCHGTAGIAHMYHNLFILTENDIFRETANYWITKTLDFGKYPDGLAGYKTWNPVTKKWETEYGLLDGIAGIGLALLSFLNPSISNWDRTLLLK